MNAGSIFTKILQYTGLLALVIAVVGGGLGYALAGTDGLWSALVGVGLAILFAAITAASMLVAIRFTLGAFFGIVMGAWLLKLVIFIVLLVVLRDQAFVDDVVLFLALVVSIIGTLAVTAVASFAPGVIANSVDLFAM